MNLETLTRTETEALKGSLHMLEMQMYSDLKALRTYYQQRLRQYGRDALWVRSALPKTFLKNLEPVEARLTQACLVFALEHTEHYNLAPKGSPLSGLDLTEVLRNRVLGEHPEGFTMVIRALEAARLTPKIRNWLLKDAFY